MTLTLLSLTAHQLLGRRRAILIALLALIPVGVALLIRFAGDTGDGPAYETATDTIVGFVFLLLLPIGALVFGTSALGSEVEDGTVVYLLAHPIARWRVVVVKAVVASAATILLTAPAALLTAVIILGGFDEESLWWAATVATVVGSVVYSTLFVGLSTVTSRALIIGLIYVFVWEAFITNLFSGTRWVSVREYVEGTANALTPVESVTGKLDGQEAAIASVVVVAASLIVGTWFLTRFEIGERA
ncbi:MAG: ABC transporter permease subunit [Chloroflexi bacterium]|nr:ABC transporter permease subunit [Chloroflexota bacterium]MYD66480.1 ABC transporter permease subunit [Chloroflexota bacterium]